MPDMTQLDNTALFQRLHDLSGGGSSLPGNVRELCEAAANRLKLFPTLHRQFTLHDEVHCVRVVELMGRVVGKYVDSLNAVEITLLILAAYCHDQGMIVEPTEIEDIRESEEWQLHDAEWSKEHPNRAEVLGRLADPLLTAEQRDKVARAAADLEAAVFTDYIRHQHGRRSARWIRSSFDDDPRAVINGRNIGELLARVCESHVLPATELHQTSRYPLDELVGTEKVNIAYVAFVLRLADILDFDRERTPDSLYRGINFTSPVSLVEWEKHRSIVGWEITPKRVAFAARCAHPAYERAVREFLGWIEGELRAAAEWCRHLPAGMERYFLDLPVSVDSSGVLPETDALTGQPRYLYMDLEFSLERDELVHLLMTSELYGSRGLFVRELLQNSLDALRHRAALFQVEGLVPPSLEVRLHHSQDDAGYDVVSCVDNGVGMELSTVVDFLTRAGRSYYRSPQFERERARFRTKGCDFDPCARFGIGFMSCFMFGDDITIRTRKDNGQGQAYGEPLVIQIAGLSGIVVVRRGTKDQQVGTSVEVRGRRKSITVDRWSDPVWLIPVINGYALATEYPIEAETTVPAINARVTVPSTYSVRPHPLETADIGGKRTFSVDLNEIDPRLRGELRVCTLADEDGGVTVSTHQAHIEVKLASGSRVDREVVTEDGRRIDLGDFHRSMQVCADGILIAGEPSRDGGERSLGSWGVPFHFGGVSGLIDARGTAKPTLTPARTPPRAPFDEDPTWTHLQGTIGRGYGRLLEKVFWEDGVDTDSAKLWRVVEAYGLSLDYLPLRLIFDRLRFPVGHTGRPEIEWLHFRDLHGASLRFRSAEGGTKWVEQLVLEDGLEFTIPQNLEEFVPEPEQAHLVGRMEALFVASSLVSIGSATALTLHPAPQSGEDLSLADYRLGQRWNAARLVRFEDGPTAPVAAYGGASLWNSNHPVVKHIQGIYRREGADLAPLDEFLRTLLWTWPSESRSRLAEETDWTRRSRWKLGRLHAAIEWADVPTPLKPPYRGFVPGNGLEQLLESDFAQWMEASP